MEIPKMIERLGLSFFAIILAACSIPRKLNSSTTIVNIELTPLLDSPTVTVMLLPPSVTPSPFSTATSTPPAYPYPQPPTRQPSTATLPPTATTTLAPPGELDRKDAASLVRWLQYGLENQDLSYIEPLLADEIWYSLAFSDHPGVILSNEKFLSELERRLPNHPLCISYAIGQGEINVLSISTEGWDPPWEFDGGEWGYLILDFSDQWTKEEGLFLFGAYVSFIWGVNDPAEVPCR